MVLVCLVGDNLGLSLMPSSSSPSDFETSSSQSLSQMIGAEPTLKLNTADFWQLLLGMQLSSQSSYQEELEYNFFGLDIQIIMIECSELSSAVTVPYNNMNKKEKKGCDRYDSQRSYGLLGAASKEFSCKTAKYRNSRMLKKSEKKLNSSEIYSQPQLVRPKRGRQQTKNAESMNKFRREFIKNSYTNYQYPQPVKHKLQAKAESTPANIVGLQQPPSFEETHYQLVRLHQNVKRMHNVT